MAASSFGAVGHAGPIGEARGAVALTPGTIGILTGRGPACDELQQWLDQIPYPHVERTRIPGNQIAWQRNVICETLRPQDEWVFFVDHDCVPPHGALERLLSHQLPLVSGAVVEGREPFHLCATKALEPFERYTAADIAGKGEPFPVAAVGTGCLLVRRAVLAALHPIPFRVHPCENPVMASLLAEDLDFSLRAAEAGFPPYLDPAVKTGHLVTAVLWPGDDGRLAAQWPTHMGRAPHRWALPPMEHL